MYNGILMAVNFQGMVITYNEAQRLPECLRSLEFCSDLLVIDLGSSDQSVEIARACGATVISHERVLTAELIRAQIYALAEHDWIVHIDPDEVFPADANAVLQATIHENPNVGLIRIPWQFYYFGQPLTSTIWGEPKVKSVALHKKRATAPARVHGGILVLDDYEMIDISSEQIAPVRHYWADSFPQLFEKHLRYLRLEGHARYQKGKRFTWRRCLSDTRRFLSKNLIEYRGLRDGGRGIFLSLFHTWYVFSAWQSLRKYQSNL